MSESWTIYARLGIIKFNIIIVANMKNLRPYEIVEVNPPKYPGHFDQQATNKLLKQLEVSLMDVEAIIIKSKNSLGMDKTPPRETLETSPSHAPSIDFNMSSDGTVSAMPDQLAYSMTPGTRSRVVSESIETRGRDSPTPKNILKKLVYEQAESILEADKEQTKINISYPQLGPSNISEQKKQNLNFPENEDQSKNVKVSLDKKQDVGRGESMEKRQYDVQEYRIVINKHIASDHIQRIEEQQYEEEPATRKISNFVHHFPIKNEHQLSNSPETKNELLLKFRTLPDHAPIKQYSQQKTGQDEKRQSLQKCNKWNTQSRVDRVKIFKERVQKYCASIIQPGNSKNISQLPEQNTCSKNELQNILAINYHSRRSQQKGISRENNEKPDCKQTKSSCKLKKQNLSPSKKPQKSTIIQSQNKVKSPIRSPSKSPNLSPLKTIQKTGLKIRSPITIKSKPTFIQKFINNIKTQKSLSSQHKPRQESPTAQNHKAIKYSHPCKSPNKKKCSAFELQEHTKTTFENVSRQKFVNKMLEQCYVRRFLTQPELSKIYQEFCRHKVARYQWQEKVIEKIFKKIHQFDQII